MKNILIFTSKLTIGGGIDSWAVLLGDNLKKEGYNIKYLTIYDYGKKNLIKNNYFSIKESYKKYSIFKRMYDTFYKRPIEIKKNCIKNNISTIISASTIPNISAIISKIFFKNKAKIIITNHLSTENSGILTKFLTKLFYKKANFIVTVSKEEELFLKDYLNVNNITTIYNSIDIKKSTQNKKIKNNKTTFINIGRLSPQKNHKLLLKYFNEYFNINKNSELLILGDGELKKELIKYKNNLEAKNNIYFLGLQKNINIFLEKSDFLLMTSNFEGFPMVFIEAMNYGIPIITHDFKTGAKEIIRGINNNKFKECNDIEQSNRGILVPFKDKEKFINSLILSRKINFNKNKIKDFVKNNFNINKNIKQWIQLIEKIK